MKITMNIEAESVTELQNAVLQMADFCSLANDVQKSVIISTVESSRNDAMQAATVQPSKPEPELAKSDTPTYTTEQVRELLEPLTETKGSDWIKALLGEMGVTNLSKMDPAQYPQLLKKAGINL